MYIYDGSVYTIIYTYIYINIYTLCAVVFHRPHFTMLVDSNNNIPLVITSACVRVYCLIVRNDDDCKIFIFYYPSIIFLTVLYPQSAAYTISAPQNNGKDYVIR